MHFAHAIVLRSWDVQIVTDYTGGLASLLGPSRRIQCDHSNDWSDAAKRKETTRTDEAGDGVLPRASRQNQPSWCPELCRHSEAAVGPLPSTTVGECICTALSHQICGQLLQRHWGTNILFELYDFGARGKCCHADSQRQLPVTSKQAQGHLRWRGWREKVTADSNYRPSVVSKYTLQEGLIPRELWRKSLSLQFG